MSDKPLHGRLALVTGAAQGIGAAIARRLADDGAEVGVNDLQESEALAAVVASTGGFPAVGDIADPAFEDLVEGIERDRRPIDVLVCNAAYMTMAPFTDDDEADWWKVVDTNLAGTFGLIQAVLPGMRRAGAGNIVVIASEWGVIGWPGASAYSASKAGLIALVKTLGRELAREN
ncbi:MAG: dehydrogenase, short-chain alcohol dehydrogenase like protein, partial [Mycobacterium sp.]|nr:dehydrogenase, short-chain alcohol dehydrogenase like protein [Mycobacterium sp.]